MPPPKKLVPVLLRTAAQTPKGHEFSPKEDSLFPQAVFLAERDNCFPHYLEPLMLLLKSNANSLPGTLTKLSFAVCRVGGLYHIPHSKVVKSKTGQQ